MCMVVFCLVSIAVVLYLPNYYTSQAVLVPQAQGNGDAGGRLAGSLGGFAQLAGIDIGNSEIDATTIAIETLKSRGFVTDFIRRHQILVPLMAGDRWNPRSRVLSIDRSDYDVESKTWVRDVNLPRTPKPSDWEAYERFEEIMRINQDQDTGIITISVEFLSPILAKQWVDWLVNDINTLMRENDTQEAEKSIAYLEGKIQETNISAVREALVHLLEQNYRTVTLANVREEYMLKTIDRAVEAEEKSRPSRGLIIALATFGGLVIGSFISLLRRNVESS